MQGCPEKGRCFFLLQGSLFSRVDPSPCYGKGSGMTQEGYIEQGFFNPPAIRLNISSSPSRNRQFPPRRKDDIPGVGDPLSCRPFYKNRERSVPIPFPKDPLPIRSPEINRQCGRLCFCQPGKGRFFCFGSSWRAIRLKIFHFSFSLGFHECAAIHRIGKNGVFLKCISDRKDLEKI